MGYPTPLKVKLNLLTVQVGLPASVRALLRAVDVRSLQAHASRLRNMADKYNTIVRRMRDHERLLFETKLQKVRATPNHVEGRSRLMYDVIMIRWTSLSRWDGRK